MAAATMAKLLQVMTMAATKAADAMTLARQINSR